MKISYNAPVSLSLSLISVFILWADSSGIVPGLIQRLFMVEGYGTFNFHDTSGYVRLISYILGHRDWDHCVGNMTLILLLGPALEERYSSFNLLVMIIFTAALGGIINALFFPTSLLGASGIVFMMIILSSFSNVRKGEFPITFFFVTALYLSHELASFINDKDISQISHILGGLCGSIFGFIEAVMKGRHRSKERGDMLK
jgi:membrane associated rhomboid family serine protease